jgi:MraZ protein
VAVFYGDSTHTVDDKGRVFVPKRFLDDLPLTPAGARIAYVSRGQDPCLSVFSESGFARALAELDTRVFHGPDLRAAKRIFFANTVKVELDASGRILIPEKLRTATNLGREVVLVGVGDRAEIWQKEAWETYEATNLQKLEDIDRAIAGEATNRNE